MFEDGSGNFMLMINSTGDSAGEVGNIQGFLLDVINRQHSLRTACDVLAHILSKILASKCPVTTITNVGICAFS